MTITTIFIELKNYKEEGKNLRGYLVHAADYNPKAGKWRNLKLYSPSLDEYIKVKPVEYSELVIMPKVCGWCENDEHFEDEYVKRGNEWYHAGCVELSRMAYEEARRDNS